MTSENGSRKFVIQFTLPSGQKLIASGFKGKFALVPVSGNRIEGMFLLFTTALEASKFMKDLRGQNQEQYDKLLGLKPEVIPVEALN